MLLADLILMYIYKKKEMQGLGEYLIFLALKKRTPKISAAK